MRVLVIGIDGATFDIIRPMIDSGELPNIGKLMKKGVYGYLKSVFPPVTFPAWTSFKTGKQPTKHGVFDFVGRYPYISDESKVITSRDVKDKSFWQILSDCGYKVGVVNVPTTYPPERVNGVMISGLGTPSLNSNFVYPKDLKDVLIKKFEYEFDVFPFEAGKEDEFIENFIRSTEKITKVVCYLLNEYEFDFFMVNYMAVDEVQHFFWGYRDEKHPWYSPKKAKYKDVIEQTYKLIDSQICKIISRVGKTNIFIVSDHGFGSAYKEVYPNEYFARVGLLSLKNNSFASKRGIKGALASKILKNKMLYYFSDKFNKIIPNFLMRRLKNYLIEKESNVNLIDWSKTKAYSGGYFGRIYINLKGREKEGIVDPKEYEKTLEEVIKVLSDWRDPETGEEIIDRIYRKEEIYPNGRYMDVAPDLTVILKDMSYVDYPGFREGKIFYPPRRSGDHRLYGIFIAYGPDIKDDRIEIKNISICDIAPTILHMFGIEKPIDMDGKILDIFNKNFKKRHSLAEREKIIKKVKELKRINKL